jgi:uncharacterized protein with PCYCGC motif
MQSVARKPILIAVVAVLLLAALPACSTSSQSSGLELMPTDRMPAEVQASASVVQQSYQFAAANPDAMKGIPCYCGCGNIGHTSNYSCYVGGVDANGKITWDDHALGCSLCVDITQDAMRLSREGKSPPEIKAYVDGAYGKYGTSNMP